MKWCFLIILVTVNVHYSNDAVLPTKYEGKFSMTDKKENTILLVT